MTTSSAAQAPLGVRVAHTLAVGFGWAGGILLAGGLLTGGLLGDLGAVGGLLLLAVVLLVAAAVLRMAVRTTARRARSRALAGMDPTVATTAVVAATAVNIGWWDAFVGGTGFFGDGSGSGGWDGGGSSGGGWGGDGGGGF